MSEIFSAIAAAATEAAKEVASTVVKEVGREIANKAVDGISSFMTKNAGEGMSAAKGGVKELQPLSREIPKFDEPGKNPIQESSAKGGFKELTPLTREIPEFEDIGEKINNGASVQAESAPETEMAEPRAATEATDSAIPRQDLTNNANEIGQNKPNNDKIPESSMTNDKVDSATERQDLPNHDDDFGKDAVNDSVPDDANIESNSLNPEKPDNSRNELQETNVTEASVEKKERADYIPHENGYWEGEPGNSQWRPDPDFIPKKSNFENNTWGQILEKHKIEGIDFKEREPDFSPIAKETVEIDGFSDSRGSNFAKADENLAEKWNGEAKDGRTDWTSDDIVEYRENNDLTWHERSDMKTMDFVSCVVHNNISHSGGISEFKKTHASE